MVETRRSRRKTRGVAEEEMETPLPRKSARRKDRSLSHDDMGTKAEHSSDGTENESDVTPIKFGGGRRGRTVSDASYFHHATMEEQIQAIERKAKQSLLPKIAEEIGEKEDGGTPTRRSPRMCHMPLINDAPPDEEKDDGTPKRRAGRLKTRPRSKSPPPTRAKNPTPSNMDQDQTQEIPAKEIQKEPETKKGKSPSSKGRSPTRAKNPTPSADPAKKDKSPTKRTKSPPRARSPTPKGVQKPADEAEFPNTAKEEHGAAVTTKVENTPTKITKMPLRSMSPTRRSPKRSVKVEPTDIHSEKTHSNEEVKEASSSKKKQGRERSKRATRSQSPTRSVQAKGTKQESSPEKEERQISKPKAKLQVKLSAKPKKSAEEPRKKKKTPKNELTSFIPGYTAKLQLDSSSLNSQRPGLEALRKRALVTDKTTSAFVKGSLANQKQTKEILTPSLTGSKKVAVAFKQGTKRQAPNHAGDKWFGMTPTPLTDEVKRDLHVIRNRSYLDPKRFYKSSDKESKFVQVGTVIEGNAEFYSSRLTKKQRRGNLTEEMMADPATADYAKRKFRTMQQEKSAKAQKRQHKKKKGKRTHA